MRSEIGTREKVSMNVKSGRPKRKCSLRIADEQREREGRRGTGRGVKRGAEERIRYIGRRRDREEGCRWRRQ